MAEPFRFLHTSDWHLERPVAGLAEVPDHLRPPLIDAPYLAAERAIDVALAERVDFVILAGDIVDIWRAGPRAAAFLRAQFDRLRQRGIDVYWICGTVDRAENWPQTIIWPRIQRVAGKRPETFIQERSGIPLARILAVPSSSHARSSGDAIEDAAGLPIIAVAHGKIDQALFAVPSIAYWALGGRHNRGTLFSDRRAAVYCGSPQGRRDHETGPHGCTLVEVDADHRVQTRFVPTDVVRWHREEVVSDRTQTLDHLESLLHERMHVLAAGFPDLPLLIQWKVTVCGDFDGHEARHLAAGWLDHLRTANGMQSPFRWSAEIELVRSDNGAASLADQDSLLGDFLRELRQVEAEASQFDLSAFISQGRRTGELISRLSLAEVPDRDRLFAEVANLATDLLQGPRGGRS